MNIQYLKIPWTEYLDLSEKIAASILQHAPKLDRIVAISRGGLTFGHLLSDLLDVPISTISIQSYKEIKNRGEIKILEELKTDIRGHNILLVDDVSDSGKTFQRALTYLNRSKPNKIITVSMFYKTLSTYRPDFFVKEVPSTKWIIFPYEMRETIFQLTKIMEKDGKSKKEIQEFFESLGYTDDQIRFVRKYFL